MTNATPAKQASRVLLYSHDSFGLGHLRRSLTIAHALAEADPEVSILCLTGSPAANLFTLPPRCDLIKIPCITKNDAGEYSSRYLPNSLEHVISLRAELIASTIRTFRPDVFLVDHTPTGPGDELRPALQRVGVESPETHVLLGLRDILDAPERAKSQIHGSGILDVLRRDYEGIIVYGDPRVLDICEAYGVPEEFRECSEYVGFVCPPPYTGNGMERTKDTANILVTAGGGEDGYALLRAVAEALLGPLQSMSTSATLITGPLMRVEESNALKKLTADDSRLNVLDVTTDMRRRLAEADLVISMGGYNSVYEALSQDRRLLVLPRMQPRLEQYERCRRLQRLGLLELLGPQTLSSPAEMAGAIAEALAKPAPLPGSSDLTFSGAKSAADKILSHCRKRQLKSGSEPVVGSR